MDVHLASSPSRRLRSRRLRGSPGVLPPSARAVGLFAALSSVFARLPSLRVRRRQPSRRTKRRRIGGAGEDGESGDRREAQSEVARRVQTGQQPMLHLSQLISRRDPISAGEPPPEESFDQ